MACTTWNFIKKTLAVLVLLLGGLDGWGLCSPAHSSEVNEKEILKKADEARGNLAGVSWRVEVKSHEKGRDNSITYEVQARGFDFFARTVAPPKSKDDKVLMVNGNMWFHKPDLSKPFPISQRQKLMGNASYGDIAATNYAEDYTVSGMIEEVENGEMCYVFDLKSSSKDRTTYDRIKYWVSKSRSLGLKAEYFTLSGKKFKTAFMKYENRVADSKPFISEIAIFDELMTDDRTSLTFDDPSLRPVEDHVFNINLMAR